MANYFEKYDSESVAAPQPRGEQSPYAGAIASIESGSREGRYDLLGPATKNGDRAHGKYQVMGANIGPWTKEVFGQALTPQQFLENPDIQDAVFNAKFGGYVQKYGPEGAAKAWFAGEKGMNNPEARDVLGTSVADYARKFNKAGGSDAAMSFAPEAAAPKQAQPANNYFSKYDNADAAEAPAPTAPPVKPVGDTFADRFSGEQPAPEPASKIPAFIRDVPKEIGAAASGAIENIKGFDPRGRGDMGVIEGMGKTGKAILGVPELIMSPITGAARSLLGHPLADATHAAGTVINPAVAAKDDPKQLYEEAKGAVDTAMSAAKPGRVSAPKAAPSPTAGQDVALAGKRLTDNVSPVDVPRAISTDSVAAQRAGQAVRNVPIVGDAIPTATAKLTGQLETATGKVADQFGSGSGPNVANRVGQVIGEAAQNEKAAASIAAEKADASILGAWEQSQQAARQQIVQAEGAALHRARQAVGDMSPQDTGEVLLARLRAGEQEARQTKDRLYGIAGQTDGSIAAESVGQVRGRVAQALDDNGRVIDTVLTPASSRMLDELQRFSSLNIENRAVGARVPGADASIAAVNMQGIEQVRKRLNSLSRAATNDADRSAAGQIVREFDNWLGDAFDNALFSGSDAALQAWRSARQANTEWRTRYGYNARDDADRVINRIVTGEVTPQEVANYVVGATRVGSTGVSSRLLTRIAEATAGDPEAIGAIRGGVWNKLSQTTEGVTAKAPEKVASEINEFLSGSGRDVARRLFTPPEQAIMRAYASTLRTGIEARQLVEEVAANTRPPKTEVGIGPLEKLAKDILGNSGVRTDEALFTAINSYAKSGARGDVMTLSKVLAAIPEAEKGALAGAVVRQIGVSPRTGQFSPDVFVSSWNSYTPQAKSLLFGMSGAQRVALDDIARISMRVKDIGARFGNPSGTAQNVNAAGFVAWLFTEPLTAISAAIGGAATAKVLASPVGASSVAKWAKAYEAVKTRPNEATMSAYSRASSALTINANQISGAPIRDTLLRLGSEAISADEEQRDPRQPRQ